MVRKFPFITSSSYLPPLSSDLHFQFPDATFCLIQNPYPIIHPLSSLLPSLCYHLLSCWFMLKYNCRWAWLAPKINLTRRWQICILPLDLFFCTGIVFLMHSETGLNDPSDWTESIIYQQGYLTQKCNPPPPLVPQAFSAILGEYRSTWSLLHCQVKRLRHFYFICNRVLLKFIAVVLSKPFVYREVHI